MFLNLEDVMQTQLPKYCESTFNAIFISKARQSKPFTELFGFETDPEYLARIKYYHLDCIIATNADGVECRIELLPEDQIKTKKRAKKPAAPKTCPHCGMSLTLKAA